MRITNITVQMRYSNRVSVAIDGKYRLSLDIAQVTELGIKQGQEIDEQKLAELDGESEYGKLYARALEYCLGRPHSVKELRDYLRRKTYEQRYKSRTTGEVKTKPGVSVAVADRVLAKLQEKNYVNDVQFTRWWVENRSQTKGASMRKLASELRAKGVDTALIDEQLASTGRNDAAELQKIIAKRASRYDDPQKLMQYLARQGFSYDDIKRALEV